MTYTRLPSRPQRSTVFDWRTAKDVERDLRRDSFAATAKARNDAAVAIKKKVYTKFRVKKG